MAADDSSDDGDGTPSRDTDEEDGIGEDIIEVESTDVSDSSDVRERLEAEADRAIEQFDESIVDLLSWILETETRARIYIHLRQQPGSTSEEIAEGTGLYPSTVREALAELHDEGTVQRSKRQNDGAGNNPYEYSAIPPSNLVGDVVEEVQNQLNTVFNLDRYLLSGDESESESEPVSITVTDVEDRSEASDEESGADSDEDGTDGSPDE